MIKRFNLRRSPVIALIFVVMSGGVGAHYIFSSQAAKAPALPAVNLETPDTDATLSGSSVLIAADASVASGSIASISIEMNNTVLTTCTDTTTCSTTWDSTSVSNATYTLELSATASDGGSSYNFYDMPVSNPVPPPTGGGGSSTGGSGGGGGGGGGSSTGGSGGSSGSGSGGGGGGGSTSTSGEGGSTINVNDSGSSGSLSVGSPTDNVPQDLGVANTAPDTLVAPSTTVDSSPSV